MRKELIYPRNQNQYFQYTVIITHLLKMLKFALQMGKQELLLKVKSLNTKMPKSSAAMIERMNITKTRVESAGARQCSKVKSITIQSGI